MGKYRGLFLLLSAVIWAFALWGISKIKPAKFFEEILDSVTVQADKDKPKPPPPPPPPPPEKLPPPPPLVERQTKVIANVAPQPQEEPRNVAKEATNIAPTNDYHPDPPPPPPPGPPPPPPPPPPPEPKCSPTDVRPLAKFDPGDAYPAEAEEKEIEGSATVVVQVDASGRVTEASVTSASNPVFRSSSVTREARSLRFSPGQNKDCDKVGGSYTFNVQFKLD